MLQFVSSKGGIVYLLIWIFAMLSACLEEFCLCIPALFYRKAKKTLVKYIYIYILKKAFLSAEVQDN
jgi:hypothetical protein